MWTLSAWELTEKPFSPSFFLSVYVDEVLNKIEILIAYNDIYLWKKYQIQTFIPWLQNKNNRLLYRMKITG